MSMKGGHKSGAESKASNSINGKNPTPAPTNAWARPLQPTKLVTAPPPGMVLPKSLTGTPSSSISSSSSSSVLLIHRERLLHLSLTLVGERVILNQKNGAIIEGIFHTFTPFSSLPIDQRNKYVLKEIHVRKQPADGSDSVNDGVTLIVPASKVVCLYAKGIATDLPIVDDTNSSSSNGSMNGGLGGNSSMLTSLGVVAASLPSQGTGSEGGDNFVTDTQISSSSGSGRKQDLVAAGNAWTAGINSSSNNGNGPYRKQTGAVGGPPLQATNSRAAALAGNNKSSNFNQQGSGGSSAVTSNMTGSIGQWDQFKANKELFNVNATFDENLYTTQLDTTQLDSKKVAEAERIANEIETTATKNIHLAEERGFKVETDFDEEDLYSGVLTKDGKQRHHVSISKKINNGKTERSSTASEQQGPNIDASKSSTSVPSTIPRKIMNYAAAAAKADTISSNNNKIAPPGFLGNNRGDDSSSLAPTTTSSTPTKNHRGENEENTAEFPTVVVTPEMKTKDAKPTQNTKPNKKDEKPSSKEKASGNGKCPETDILAANDKNDEPKDRLSVPSESDGNENMESEIEKVKEKKEESKDSGKSSKLNANAKSFTFNPTAKSFTPGAAGSNNNPAPQQPQQHAATSDPSMQMYGLGHPMQPPHYLQAGPMGQPGMVPMINPQYPGMRYPSSSYCMEQSMPQMQHQSPHVQAVSSVPSAPNSGNATASTPGNGLNNSTEDDSTRPTREGDDLSQKQGGGQQHPPQRSQQQQQSDQTSQPQVQPLQQQQPQQIPIPYNIPPGAYFTGGIPGMPPRGPGYAQFVTGPQQIAGRPVVPPYGIYPMQPGGMPPNMQMRGPNGAQYYPGPNGPIPYPPGTHMGYPMMDDGGGTDYRGRGGRSSSSSSSTNGPNRGRANNRPRSNTGRGGQGRGGRSNNNGYNSNHNSSVTNGKNHHHQQYSHQQQQNQPSQQQHQSAAPLVHFSKSNNDSSNNKGD